MMLVWVMLGLVLSLMLVPVSVSELLMIFAVEFDVAPQRPVEFSETSRQSIDHKS